MDIEQKEQLWDIYEALGETALVMNHYDLAKKTKIPAKQWKDFLNEQDVKEWRDSEFKLIQDSELKKMTKDISVSRSVGQAQLMTALNKMQGTEDTKEGPAFIYCYVPLNKAEEKADNIVKLDSDIFLKEVQE